MTSSIKWEPIEDLKALRELIGKSVVGKISAKLVEGRPAMDLYETEDAYIAEIDAPGVAVEGLEVSVYGSEVTISLCRQPVEGRNYLYQERPTGTISRRIKMPDTVNAEEISARLSNGLLILNMPKRQDAKGIKIEVTAPKS